MEGVGALERLAPDAVAEAAAAIRRDGAAVVEQVWPAELIDRLRAAVFAQHPEFSDPDLLDDYLGTKDVRYLAPVTVSAPILATGVLTAPALVGLCKALLGADFVYEAFGIMMVYPGVKAQKGHRDGGDLFPETGIDRILPPSALTIAIPLVDVDAELAPTGVAVGTHREIADPEAVPLTPVELRRGDIAVWDFRVVHAGLENRTDRTRPALYITACRPFWIDHTNFQDTARVRLGAEVGVLGALGPRFVRAQAVPLAT